MRLLIIIGLCVAGIIWGGYAIKKRFEKPIVESSAVGSRSGPSTLDSKDKETVPVYYQFKNRPAPDMGTRDALTNIVKMEVPVKQVRQWLDYMKALDEAQERRSARIQLFEIRRNDGDTLKLSTTLNMFKARIEMTPIGMPFAFGEISNLSAFLFQDTQVGSAKLTLDTQVSLCSGEAAIFSDTGQQVINQVTTTTTSTTQASSFQDVGLSFILHPVALRSQFIIGYEWINSQIQTEQTRTQQTLDGSMVLSTRPTVILSAVRQAESKKRNSFLFIPVGVSNVSTAIQSVLVISQIDGPDGHGHAPKALPVIVIPKEAQTPPAASQVPSKPLVISGASVFLQPARRVPAVQSNARADRPAGTQGERSEPRPAGP